MAILLFFGVLFVLILVHEWGHFIVAKKTGMRVDEFGIGFPPKLFGKKWHGTEYTFNALPIGGFVKIAGENAEDISEKGEVPDDSFSAKSKWAQAAVLIAGVTMNILFAWVLFVGILFSGMPSAVDESTASENAVLTVTQVLNDGPADKTAIPIGATLLELRTDTQSLDSLTPSTFSAFIKENGVNPITIVFTYNNTIQEVTLTPEIGLIVSDPEQPAVGVALSMVETVRMPIVTAVIEATKMTFHSLVAIVTGLGTLLIESIQGTADYSQVAGPVGIVGMVGDAAQFGFISLLLFTAMISLNLAVINLLPFPALDGGRLVMVAIEALTRRPINPVWVGRINTIGFVLLLALMVAVTFSDITKLL